MSSSHLANFPHIEGDVLGKSAAEMNLDVPEKTSDSHASCANNARSPVQDMKAKSGSQQKKGPGHKSSVCTLLEDSVEASEQHPGTGRKKRARSTPDETDANGRKSVCSVLHFVLFFSFKKMLPCGGYYLPGLLVLVFSIVLVLDVILKRVTCIYFC